MKNQVVESIAMPERKGLGRLKFYRTPTMQRASFTAKDLLIFLIIINLLYLLSQSICHMVVLRRSLFSDCCFRRYQDIECPMACVGRDRPRARGFPPQSMPRADFLCVRLAKLRQLHFGCTPLRTGT